MPTWERTARFDRDWEALVTDDRERFRRAARHFVDDLHRERFRAGLRVKRVQGTDDVFELTWSADGRATFQYGTGSDAGPHVIWRRIGRHDSLRRP
jgi:hypothetical protein